MDKIQPVDDLVRAGFQQKLIEQFRCPVTWTTSPDKLAALKTMLGNEQPVYPYMFLTIQNTSPNIDSYMSHRLARYGIPVAISDDRKQQFYVQLHPQNFEVEVTFITNKYSGDLEAVEGFVRRWMFSRRNGYLQYRINYGQTTLDIASQLTETLSIPQRENPAEQESVYQVVATATIKGYIGEAVLLARQRILEVEIDTKVASATGLGSADVQFFPFPEQE